jgi:hypothetical protein
MLPGEFVPEFILAIVVKFLPFGSRSPSSSGNAPDLP